MFEDIEVNVRIWYFRGQAF